MIRSVIICLFLLSFICSANEGAMLLVNGGEGADNRCEFYKDLEKMQNAAKNFIKQIVLGPVDCESSFWQSSSSVKPKARATKLEIEKNIVDLLKNTPKGSPISLFFTDHGGNNGTSPHTSNVCLNNNERLSVEELNRFVMIIKNADPSRKVVLVHDHCFSAGMLEALKDNSGKVISNTCGFSAANEKEFSYDGESLALAADRLSTSAMRDNRSYDNNKNGKISFSEMFNYRKKQSGSSVPVSSSDSFLQNYLESHPQNVIKLSLEVLGSEHCSVLDKVDEKFNQLIGDAALIGLYWRDTQLKSDLKILCRQYSSLFQSAKSACRDFKKMNLEIIKDEKNVNELILQIKNEKLKIPKIYKEAMSAVFGSRFDRYKTINQRYAEAIEYRKNPKMFCLGERKESRCCTNPIECNEGNSYAEILTIPSTDFVFFNKAYEDFGTGKLDDPKAKSFKRQLEDLLAKYSHLNSKMSAINKDLKERRMIIKTSQQINALQAMMDNQDVAAIEQYLNLVDCEDTELGKFR